MQRKNTILTAPRCSHTGMHVLNMQNPLIHLTQVVNDSLANIKHTFTNIQEFIDADRVKFLYTSLGGLPLSTVKQAIKEGFLQSWSGLTVKKLNRLPEPDCTALGHADHTHKKLSKKRSYRIGSCIRNSHLQHIT